MTVFNKDECFSKGDRVRELEQNGLGFNAGEYVIKVIRIIFALFEIKNNILYSLKVLHKNEWMFCLKSLYSCLWRAKHLKLMIRNNQSACLLF